jgi:hypothetical protein
VTVVPRANVVRVQKFAARSFVDATLFDAAHLPDRRIHEAMTQANISFGSDAEHSEACAARVGFTDPGVQLFQRVARIRKAVLPVL